MRKAVAILILLSSCLYAEEILSIKEERSQTILYGIDEEVIELIKELKSEENETFNQGLLDLLNMTANQKLKISIIDLFKDQENDIGAQWALNILQAEEEDYDQALILSCMSYLRIIKYTELRDVLEYYLEDEDMVISLEAIKALGAVGTEKDASRLSDLYEDDDIDDQVRPEILRSMGAIGSTDNQDKLIELALSDEDDNDIRLSALWALGEIQSSDALKALKTALEDEDPFIRTEALAGLIKFKNEDNSSLFIKSLRDSYWKIRLEALKGVGDNNITKALNHVLYKAKKDPVEKVRLEALETLAILNLEEGISYLQKLYTNKNTAPKIRQQAFLSLLEHQKDKLSESIKEVIKEEWEEEKSWILDITGKNIATREYKPFKDFYEQFLTHKNYIIQIYGIRGLQNNEITDAKDKVLPLAGEKQNGFLRKYAYSYLEEIGMSKEDVDKANKERESNKDSEELDA